MKYRLVRFLPGIRVLWVSNKILWATKQNNIITSRDHGQSWASVTTISVPPIQYVLSRIELCRRLLRLGIRSYVQVNDREFVAFSNGVIFRWRQGDRRPIRIGDVRHGSGPLLQGCCADDKADCYYGEYWRNPGGDETHIYKLSSQSMRWEVFYTFSRGAIRHIHAVQFDPISKALWVATGDDDKQCQIGYFKKSSSVPELVTIVSGSQMARAVSLLFTRDYVYWGTDAGRGTRVKANHMYRWSRQNGRIEQVGQVGAPVYYSIVDEKERLFVSTVVEGSASEPDRFARVWMSENGLCWEEIGRWNKDKYPFLFGYGVLSFPGGLPADSKMYVIGNGVDQSTGTWVLEEV